VKSLCQKTHVKEYRKGSGYAPNDEELGVTEPYASERLATWVVTSVHHDDGKRNRGYDRRGTDYDLDFIFCLLGHVLSMPHCRKKFKTKTKKFTAKFVCYFAKLRT